MGYGGQVTPGFEVVRLGRTTYPQAFEIQQSRVTAILAGEASNALFLTEHDPVLTLGANFHPANLLLTDDEYAKQGIAVHRTNRGGDVTFHGPGQLVAYPVFDLSTLRKDLHWWLRTIEEVVIQTLQEFGVEGRRFPPHTGVWIEDRKVCAIGIAVKRWVSMHGLAINCDNDLSPFETIIPCGIEGYGVTSLSQVVGRVISTSEAAIVLEKNFSELFV